jgi:hypothetical protein
MRSAPVLLALSLALTACSSAPPPVEGTPDEPTASEPARPSSDAPATPSPSPTRTPTPTRAEADARDGVATVERISPAVRDRMRASHRPGCPVPLRNLRYLRLPFVDFDGAVRRGEMVVAARHADDVVQVFAELFEARFPIRRMVLVDEYGGDDDRSMAANNTSAFNCRPVAGTDRWSEHAFGGAIDINPVQNPYVRGSSYVPEEGAAYVDVPRGPRAQPDPGVIVADGVVVRAFERIGWEWGGTWTSSKDYQHFSAGGG